MKDQTLQELNDQFGTLPQSDSLINAPSVLRPIINLGDAVLDFEGLLGIDLPVREKILPWLPAGGLAMVAAERGLGKTHFALSLAGYLAGNKSFMKWPVSRPRNVLYVDGEMALSDIRQRLREFVNEKPKGNLQVLSHELFYAKYEKDLCISDDTTQQAILTLLNKCNIDLLILDNLSSLTNIREDKADDWRNHMLPFLIACRRRGTAVLIVHHCGKGGEQRGTGAREDHLDTSIKLIKSDDVTNTEGCRFQVVFTKSRGCYGKPVESFIASLVKDNGSLAWELTSLEESTKDRLIQLINDAGDEGINVTQASQELGVTKGMVSRLKNELESEGVIQFSRGKNPMKIAANWKRTK
ncbi:MAG: AAA family ATPase [Coxiellaceae bacterium]|nr:MAG: AAA family ATPase [Coxiellaceae bacterium]